MRLTGRDIVRHRLVQEIVRAYDEEPKRKDRQRRRINWNLNTQFYFIHVDRQPKENSI